MTNNRIDEPTIGTAPATKLSPATIVESAQFFKEHPTLPAITTSYKKLDIDGQLVEFWELLDDERWVDHTELKRAEMLVAQLRKELRMLTEFQDALDDDAQMQGLEEEPEED